MKIRLATYRAECNYGKILSRTVLYRGKSFAPKKGVEYRNVAAVLTETKKVAYG